MQLIVESNGAIRCLYDETISLGRLGRLTIRRGSHVEADECGCWHTDLSPLGGPMLGPFSLRSEALLAESTWIKRHWLNHLDG